MKNAIAFKFDERLDGRSQAHGVAVLYRDALADVLIIDVGLYRSVVVSFKENKTSHAFASPLTQENLIELFTQ